MAGEEKKIENPEETIETPVKDEGNKDITPESVKEEGVKPEENKLEEKDKQPSEIEDNQETDKDEKDTNENKDGESSDEDKEKNVDLADVQESDKAKEILQDKGFDYAKLQEEYNQSGDISKETREELSKVGITDEILNNYIEGQKAKAEKELDSISEGIGGRESFDTVIKWAGENLSEDEISSINAVRDINVMKIILKDLKTRMDDKEGIAPEYTKGDGGKPSIEIFRSQAEMFEAINDPKYKKDNAYRLDIQKKITASREAGIDLGI